MRTRWKRETTGANAPVSRIKLVVGIVLAVAIAAHPAESFARRAAPSGSTLSKPKAPRRVLAIAVRVENYAEAPPAEVQSSEVVAASIIRAAGVRVDWIACPGPHDQVPANFWKAERVCAEPPGASIIDLRILNGSPVLRTHLGQDTFGYAVPDMANVFYDRALALGHELGGTEEPDIILGHLIAHEIGHVLLGPEHWPIGVMRGNWDRGYVEGMVMAGHGFTRDQGARMREAVRSRLGQPAISLPARASGR